MKKYILIVLVFFLLSIQLYAINEKPNTSLFVYLTDLFSGDTVTVDNGNLFTSAFLTEVAKGNVPGHSIVNKFGHNPVSGADEDVWGGGDIYGFYPSVVQDIDIESDSDEDNGTGTHTGAKEVTVFGLCLGFIECEETATMDGQDPVQLTNQYIRLYRAFVRISGTDETNAGNITAHVRGSALAADIGLHITAEHGQTQQAIYTIPAGKTAYFIKGYVGLSTSSNQNHTGTFNWLLRVNVFGPGGAWLVQGEVGLVNTGTSYWIYEYGAPAGPILEMTDIRITLMTGTIDFDTVAGYDLLLVEDGF